MTQTPEAPRDYEPPALPQLSSETVGSSASLVNLIQKGKGVWDSKGIVLTELPSGKFSVSAPNIPAGAKLKFRLDEYIPGTRYNVSTLPSVTAKSLLWKSAKGLGLNILLSAGSNLINYGWGEYSDIGIVSNEFAASTLVDFAQAGLTGIAAAGTTGVVLMGAAAVAAGFGLTLTAPLWAAGAATIGVGLWISARVESLIDINGIKQQVANGFSAWGGVFENAKKIVSVGTERTIEAVSNFANDVVNAGRNVAETVMGAVQQTGQAVSNAISRAADSVTSFLGGLFGGGS